MRSTTAARHAEVAPDDRTAKARIRDAAIARFAADGVRGASVRAIADDAGVSAGLVIHHFGSKDGLRAACDEHVAALIAQRKRAAMAEGPQLDLLGALRQSGHGPPILRYLARTLVDGSPRVNDLVDGMVADAVGYMEEGVRSGAVTPSDQPFERAAVLTTWVLGALVLHEHLHRLIGVDLTTPMDSTEAARPYMGPALEILGGGVLTDEMAAAARSALTPPAREEETGS